jgi:hypothetical protein
MGDATVAVGVEGVGSGLGEGVDVDVGAGLGVGVGAGVGDGVGEGEGVGEGDGVGVGVGEGVGVGVVEDNEVEEGTELMPLPHPLTRPKTMSAMAHRLIIPTSNDWHRRNFAINGDLLLWL